ncbi:MAG TPA: hypothetical protein ENI62_02695 [Gammaproteobacteria bacterium]|nr:hypothetical protein [Gammaproteobacteria bacterium]
MNFNPHFPPEFRDMRVCVLKYRPNGIAQDLLDALDELGSTIRVFDVAQCRTEVRGGVRIEYTVDGETDTVPYLYRQIDSFDPHIILVLNNQGMEGNALLYAIADLKEIPLVNWYFDDPEFFPDSLLSADPAFVCYAVIDDNHADRLRARGNRNVVLIPIGVNRRRFEKYAQIPSTHEYQVTFVGKSGQTHINQIRKEIETGMGGIPDSMRRGLDAIIEQAALRIHTNPGMTARTVLDEIIAVTPGFAQFGDHPQVRPRLLSIFDFKASFSLRRDTINSVSNAEVTIIGDHFWQPYLHPTARLLPSVSYDQIGTVYRNSDVNINVSRYQLIESVNQRAFDVPVAGGFLLTDYKTGIDKLFDPGREIICYTDGADLDDKVNYYLAHPEKRQSVIEQGRERILQDHTYAKRLISLLTELDKLGIRKGSVPPGEITQRKLAPGLGEKLEKLAGVLEKSGQTETARRIGQKLDRGTGHRSYTR